MTISIAGSMAGPMAVKPPGTGEDPTWHPPRRPKPVDPLPLAMLSPASAVAAGDDPSPPEFIVVSEKPPARVLP